MTTEQNTINMQHSENPYAHLTPAEMMAKLMEKDAQLASKTKRKTKRKKVDRPTHSDYTCFHPTLLIPPKIATKEKKDFIASLLDYGLPDEDYAKYLIKFAKDKEGRNKIRLFKVITHHYGKMTTNIYIIHLPKQSEDEEVVELPKKKEGVKSIFSLLEEVDLSPRDFLYNWFSIQHDLYTPKDADYEEIDYKGDWFISAIEDTEKPIYVPTETNVINNLLKPTKEEMHEAFAMLMFRSGDLTPEAFFQRKLFLYSVDDLKIKSTSGKGKYVGTTLSKQYDENGNEVEADLTKLSDRKKYIKIKYEGEKRCDCLMEKKGKQRCGGEAKWRLPNGRRICSSHGGNVLQTQFLLGKDAPADYAHGVRAGWCEKNCVGHDCKCEKNTAQQDKCKLLYAGLNEAQVKEYRELKNRLKTDYDAIFGAYKM